MKNICTYDNFTVAEHNNKLYYFDEEHIATEVELIKAVDALCFTEEQLLFDEMPDDCLAAGELDEEAIYCYWAIKI